MLRSCQETFSGEKKSGARRAHLLAAGERLSVDPEESPQLQGISKVAPSLMYAASVGQLFEWEAMPDLLAPVSQERKSDNQQSERIQQYTLWRESCSTTAIMGSVHVEKKGKSQYSTILPPCPLLVTSSKDVLRLTCAASWLAVL